VACRVFPRGMGAWALEKREQAARRPRLFSGGVAGHEFALEFAEAAFGDGLAGLFHELEVEVEIVEGEDALRRDFSGAETVAEEGAREAGDVGVGVFGERGGVKLELLVFNVDGAVVGEGLAVAGAAGRVDAVEHVDALADHFEKLGGGAEAHGVAGLILGEERFGILNGGEHFFLGFADRDATDGVAVEIEIDEGARRFFAEIGVDAALDDAEVELAALAGGGLVRFDPIFAALSPAGGEAGGILGVFTLARIRGAFVEEHGDIGAEDGLDFHALFGAEHHAGAIEVALELHAGLGDFSDFRKGPDLEAAGVGEHGAVPSGEGVEAAEFFDDLGAGAEPEVVGIAKDDLGVDHVEVVGMEGFDRSLGADGHENGGFDHTVRGGEAAAAGFGVGVGGEEFEHGTGRVLTQVWGNEHGISGAVESIDPENIWTFTRRR
jgi:hypothetical protein